MTKAIRINLIGSMILSLGLTPVDSYAQLRDTTLHVQYPTKGFVLLNSGEKVSIKGLNYANSDSLILFEKGAPFNGISVYRNLSIIPNVHPRVEAISNIKLLKENRNATSKGATVGAIVGFGLGYLVGYLSYEESISRTEEEESYRRRTRAGWHGLLGAVPVGLSGALIGRVVLRKRFTIAGSKERLNTALRKVY